MKNRLYRWRIRLLAWLAPALLFERLSALDWYGGLLQQWTQSALQTPGQRLLDVGCATGYLAGFLQSQGHRVSALDASQAMIARAQRAFPAVNFHHADALHMPFNDGEFDQVFCASLLNVVDDPAQLIRELQRVTRPGGGIHFLFPQSGFDEKEFQTLNRRLKLHGFSRAALYSWHRMAVKKSRGEALQLLQKAGLEIARETQWLDGLVLAISINRVYS